MATVYSLICFGGRTGKTVTISNASPAAVTLTNHGLRDGFGVVFSTTGALPAGVTAGTTYYAKSIASNQFNLYDTSANAIAGGTTGRVNTSTAGSGTHTVKSANLLALASLSRWGSSGSERVYDGLSSYVSARTSGTTGLDEEIGECLDDFYDFISGTLLIKAGAAPKTLITSMVNGARSVAYHTGVVDKGYVVCPPGSSPYVENFTTIDGISFRPQTSTSDTLLLYIQGIRSKALGCVFFGYGTTYGTGPTIIGSEGSVINCLVTSLKSGIVNYGGDQGYVCNNTVTKCATGISSSGGATTYRYGYWYNNISVGNTTNWGAVPTSLQGASKNFGESGNSPWVKSPGTTGTMATTDFYNYATNDFRPALSASPQVDVALEFYNIPNSDIKDAERPNYNNGGAEGYDVGCYEFDNGYGPHPASYALELTGIPAGSEVRCYTGSKGASAVEIGGIETSTGTSFLFSHSSAGVAGFVHVIHPNYAIQEFDYTYQAANTSIPVQMQVDRWYSNPA